MIKENYWWINKTSVKTNLVDCFLCENVYVGITRIEPKCEKRDEGKVRHVEISES